MSKKKDPMALFEILSKQDNPKSATKVPAWMKNKDLSAEQQEALRQAAAANDEDENVETAEDEVYIEGIQAIDEPTQNMAASMETEVEDIDEPLLVEESIEDEDVDEDDFDDQLDDEVEDEIEYDDDDDDDQPLPGDEDDIEEQLDDEEQGDDHEDLDEEDMIEPDALDDDFDEHLTEPPPLPKDPIAPSEAREGQGWLVWQVRENRLNVSLPVLVAGIAAGCVLVVLVAAFVIGRLSAPEPTPVAASEAPSTVNDPPLANNLVPVDTTQAPVVLAEDGTRMSGRHYLVIETLTGKDAAAIAEAKRIRSFAANRGIIADLQWMGSDANKKLVVWSLAGFASPTSPQALGYARKVEDVGKAYFNRYGTYKFLQRRDGNFQPFFVTAP